MVTRAFHHRGAAVPAPGPRAAAADAQGRLPPPRTPSEPRKQRDAALRTLDEQIADHLADSARSGELRSAPSWGREMPEMEGYAQTPPEFRLPFKILKNAGVPPPEVALFQQRGQLREALAAAPEGPGRRALQQRLAELEQVLALRLEHLRATGSL